MEQILIKMKILWTKSSWTYFELKLILINIPPKLVDFKENQLWSILIDLVIRPLN